MKKIYILALMFGAFSLSSNAQIDQTEDFEGFSLGPISSQSDLFKTWSGEEGGVEDAIVSSDFAVSGSKSLMIDGIGAPAGKDQLCLIDSQPDTGIYTIQFNYFVPTDKEGYFNLQGEIFGEDQGDGSFATPDIYFNPDNTTPGQGQIADGTISWLFPQNTWFQVRLVVDIDTQTFEMLIDGTEAIPSGTEFSAFVPYIGAIDFYAPSEDSTYYIDDIITAYGTLGTDDFAAQVFSVYPNPVKDVLNIKSKVAVDNVTIYDILGKAVLSENTGIVSPSINTANLASGIYLVKATIGNSSKTVKIVK